MLISSHSLLPTSLTPATTSLLSVSMDVPVQDTLFGGIIQHGAFVTVPFTLHNVFKVHPCYSMHHTLFLFMAE